MNDGHVGLDLESGFEGFQSLFVPAQIVECDTEVAIAVGNRIFFDCLIELFDGFSCAACGDEGIGVIAARLPGVCVAVDDGLPERIDGLVGGGLLPSEDSTDDQNDQRDDLNELGFTQVSVLPEVADKGEKGEGGHVYPTVCNPGVEHAIDVEEAREGEEHAEKEKGSCSGATPAALEGFPGEECCHQNAEDESCPLIPDGGVEMPAIVDDANWVGPEKFAQIKGNGLSGDDEAIDEGEFKFFTAGTEDFGFHPRDEDAGGDGDHEHGEDRQEVAFPGEFLVLPPTDDEDGGGEDESRDFGENGSDKQKEGKPPPGPGAGRGVWTPAMEAAAVGEEGCEDQGLAEDVLTLGDPGDGFSHDRMNDVEGGGKEGAAYAQLAENEPEENA